MLLKTRYDKHFYNSWRVTQLQHQFTKLTPNVNETEITKGIRSEYSGRKMAKNQAETLRIECCTNLAHALEEAGKGPAATHIINMQRIEEYRTLARRIKYTKGKFS